MRTEYDIQDAAREVRESVESLERTVQAIDAEQPSLRDRFAMAALTGLTGSEAIVDQGCGKDSDKKAAKLYAEAAYLIADAMLTERQRGGKP